MTDTSSLSASIKRVLLFIAYMVVVSLIASGLTIYRMHTREIAARVAYNAQLAASDSAIAVLTDSLEHTTDALHASMADASAAIDAWDALAATSPRIAYVHDTIPSHVDSTGALATTVPPQPDSFPAVPWGTFAAVRNAGHGVVASCSRLLHDCATNDRTHRATEALMQTTIDQLRVQPPRVDTVQVVGGVARWKHDIKLIGITALSSSAVCGVVRR